MAEVQPGSGERNRECGQLLRNGRVPFDDPEPISDVGRVRKMCELCRELPEKAGRQLAAQGQRLDDVAIGAGEQAHLAVELWMLTSEAMFAEQDRKSTRLNSSHLLASRMPSSS